MMSNRIKLLVGGCTFAAFLLVGVLGIATLMPSVAAENHRHSSVTGYFGLDDDGMPIVSRHGIMLVFDGAIAPETVSVGTFEVSLNDGTFAEIVETQVEGEDVFLRLKDELASDATPIVGIAEGEEVEDLAGNSTNKRKLGFVQIEDGIAPRLTVTLSGGSGRGTGDEGADRLTKDTIDIHIASDEALQGAPRVIVVCESLTWLDGDGARQGERDIDDFRSNRSGAFANRPKEPPDTSYTCGYDADGDGVPDDFEWLERLTTSRQGDTWEYIWQNHEYAPTMLHDGELVVVAYGRDRSRFERFGETVSNWAAGTAGFVLDTELMSVGVLDGVKVFPEDGSRTSEARPFVLIEFAETDAVNLGTVIFDGVEISDDFVDHGDNRYVYWPKSMNQGLHKVEVEALDVAGNVVRFDFRFDVVGRGDFVLELKAGWNAISVPWNPIDPKIEAVFTDPAIETVIGWNDGRWHLAVRRGKTWVANPRYEAIRRVSAGFGYWVRSSANVEQPISLQAPISRNTEFLDRDLPPAEPGWNFVGVIDSTGDQTEDHYGEVLLNIRGEPIYAREYLSDYALAFTWDPIGGRFEPLLPGAKMTIGDGVWVYY